MAYFPLWLHEKCRSCWSRVSECCVACDCPTWQNTTKFEFPGNNGGYQLVGIFLSMSSCWSIRYSWVTNRKILRQLATCGKKHRWVVDEYIQNFKSHKPSAERVSLWYFRHTWHPSNIHHSSSHGCLSTQQELLLLL